MNHRPLLAAHGRCLCCLLSFFMLVGLLSPTAAQESLQGRSRFLHWSYQDAVGLAQSINPRTPLYMIGAAAALAPLSTLDNQFGHEIGEMNRGDFSQYLSLTNELGGPRMNIPVTAIFVASLATENRRLQDAAFTSLQSMVYAGAISYSIKYAVGRFRPEEGLGPFQLVPFSGHSSFPSGHTVTAFAVITPWVLYYPHPVTYGLFALSAGTAVSRIAREKHWATDVLAGGSIGFLTAYWLTKRHQGSLQGISITPSIGADNASLQIRVRL